MTASTVETAATTLDAALVLAARGDSVIPLRGKEPALRQSLDCIANKCIGGCGRFGHGVRDASSDPDVIRAMWTAAGPGSNIGLKIALSWLVVDDDASEWLREQPPLTPTVGQITGRRNGRHHIYQHPGGPIDRRRLKDTRVDILDSTRYIVAAPSIHPDTGRRYRWTGQEHGVQPLPSWLRELLQPPTPEPATDQDNPRSQLRRDQGSQRRPFPPHLRYADRFNETADWHRLLTAAGWTPRGKHWTRPGKNRGHSAWLYEGRLYIGSTNADLYAEQPTGGKGWLHGYSPFDFWVATAHNGDRRAALRELRQGAGR